MLRPWTVTAATLPHAPAATSGSHEWTESPPSFTPFRTFMVSGSSRRLSGCVSTPDTALTKASIFFGRARRPAPAPLCATRSIGQPMLRSRKSASVASETSCAALASASAWPPAICTPHARSLACLLSSAHSCGLPCRRLVARAISEQVTSAPRLTASARKGRLPTVVSGAR